MEAPAPKWLLVLLKLSEFVLIGGGSSWFVSLAAWTHTVVSGGYARIVYIEAALWCDVKHCLWQSGWVVETWWRPCVGFDCSSGLGGRLELWRQRVICNICESRAWFSAGLTTMTFLKQAAVPLEVLVETPPSLAHSFGQVTLSAFWGCFSSSGVVLGSSFGLSIPRSPSSSAAVAVLLVISMMVGWYGGLGVE
jgi:hypothetical protein